MKLVYISAPITLGDRNYNWFVAAQAQVALMRAGYAVVNPMSSMPMPEAVNIDWQTWLEMDEEIVSRCDMVLRLPHGESSGRDRECDFARARGIPVLAPSDFPCLADLFTEERRAA